MSLSPGTRLGPYEVTALIGQGGMGEVYRARDTKLGRDVALKVLPDVFADDPERLARFQREARVLASLNHPNIASIYGLEESEGVRALVLELVEGPTLAERIAQGAIPVDEALPIAKQIADALEAAHEAGVIHRDLKPANVKVKADGMVKVLDFGLAKALEGGTGGDPSESPTLTAAATKQGVIMGTAAYMSPEQASGKTVDKRADVWAFGVVLYEMLTGTRPFVGDDVSKTLARVIAIDPDWSALPKDLPPVLGSFLRGSLAKNPRERVRDIGDVRLAMKGAFETTVTAPSAPPAVPKLQVWQRPVPATISALALLAIGGLTIWTLTRPDVIPADLIRFTIVPPDTAPLDLPGQARDLAISPDGTQVVYQSRLPGVGLRLNLRPIDQLVGAPVRGTEGGAGPFVSPDGEWVGFVASTGGRTLQKVSIFGGPPVTLTESPNGILGASWGADDQIIFGTNGAGLFRVSGGGGEPEVLTTLDADQGEANHVWPFIIPGREAVMFVIGTGAPLTTGQLAVLDLDTGKVTRLGLAGVSPHYVSTGHLVYAAEDGSVRAVPFDATSLDVTGNPVLLVEGVAVKVSGAANFGISDNGRLVYMLGTAVSGPALWEFVWVDRQGNEEPLPLAPRRYVYPRVSPDGQRIATSVLRESGRDLWVYDVANGAGLRLTLDDELNHVPLWTPDGERILFSSTKNAPRPPSHSVTWWGNVYAVPADGSGEAERLTTSDESQALTGITPDGLTMVYTRVTRAVWEIMAVPTDGAAEPQALVSGPFRRGTATISPDGRWLAYRSDEAGAFELYVQPYPGPGAKVPVSVGGGNAPVWSHDGRELFYRDGEDTMTAVTIEDGQMLRVGRPTALFPASSYRAGGTSARQYHVAPDGRFLMMKRFVESGDDAESPPQITVVLNWHQELLERVPVP